MAFRKIQKISSIIPLYSTKYIVFVTMIQLKKNNATYSCWLRFFLLGSLACIFGFAIYNIFLPNQNIIIQMIAAGIPCSIINFKLVDLQERVNTGE